MKRLILVLFIGLLFLSCEKEAKFIEVEIVSIDANNDNSTIIYEITNNSDMDIECNVIFDIDGTMQKEYKIDCVIYPAHYNSELGFISTGYVNSADYKVKLCGI